MDFIVPFPEGEGTAIHAVRKYQVNAVAQDNIFHRFNEGQLKIKVLGLQSPRRSATYLIGERPSRNRLEWLNKEGRYREAAFNLSKVGRMSKVASTFFLVK